MQDDHRCGACFTVCATEKLHGQKYGFGVLSCRLNRKQVSSIPTCLTIAGLRVDTLTREFGTPLYVYDAGIIVRQLKRLSAALPERHSIRYAAKALTNPSILRLVKDHGAGLDCVSLQEVQIGLRCGFDPEKISFTPNNVSLREVQEAVSLGVEITLDNLSILEAFGKTYGDGYPVAVRINPHIMAGGNLKISTGHRLSKFGISLEQRDDILRVADQYGLRINGLHIHTGSEIKDNAVFMQAANVLLDMAPAFPHLRFIDFGGGFKVAYRAGDAVTDIEALGQLLSEALENHRKKHGQDLTLKVEPGKFLVSEAGSLLTEVTVVKETPAVTFVGVDTGLNHLIRPMMYDAWHDIENGTNAAGPERTYTIVGNICETDTFGADRTLPEVREGDVLIIRNAGAYGHSMASNYNSRFRPAEVLIENGEARLIRRRDTLEDLLRGTEL